MRFPSPFFNGLCHLLLIIAPYIATSVTDHGPVVVKYRAIVLMTIGACKVIIQKTIEEKLQAALIIDHLQVINESHMHNVPDGSESHFKLVVVSAVFEGMRPIQRQQKIYSILAEEIAGPVHALTMQTLTPEQWQEDASITASPQCMGGSKSS